MASEDEQAELLPRHRALLAGMNGGREPKPSVQANGTVQLRQSRSRDRPLPRGARRRDGQGADEKRCRGLSTRHRPRSSPRSCAASSTPTAVSTTARKQPLRRPRLGIRRPAARSPAAAHDVRGRTAASTPRRGRRAPTFTYVRQATAQSSTTTRSRCSTCGSRRRRSLAFADADRVRTMPTKAEARCGRSHAPVLPHRRDRSPRRARRRRRRADLQPERAAQPLVRRERHRRAQLLASTCTSTTRRATWRRLNLLKFLDDDDADVRRRRLQARRRGGLHRPGDPGRPGRLPDRADRRDVPPLPPARPRLRQPRRPADGAGPALRLRRGPGVGGGHHRAHDRPRLRRPARTAARMGPFAGYAENTEHMLRVLASTATAAADIDEELVPAELLGAAQQAWDDAVRARPRGTASATRRPVSSRRPAPSA